MLCDSISFCYVSLLCLFFFFKQKTAYEMRISDWSSDVCSSDLDPLATLHDLKHITDQLLVRNPSYRCTRCGFGARSHHWQCPSCKEWGTVKPLLNYAVV